MTGATPESLDKRVEHIEEEARMILPGIQALFGFQLIAVFNQRFTDLSHTAQLTHFVALLCSAFAVLLVLTPAAYHRQAEPSSISERLCRIGTKCLTLAFAPLSVAIAGDIGVIGELLEFSPMLSVGIAVAVFLALVGAWFVFPRLVRAQIQTT